MTNAHVADRRSRSADRENCQQQNCCDPGSCARQRQRDCRDADSCASLDRRSSGPEVFALGARLYTSRQSKLRQERPGFPHGNERSNNCSRSADGVEQPRQHQFGIDQAIGSLGQCQRDDMDKAIASLARSDVFAVGTGQRAEGAISSASSMLP